MMRLSEIAYVTHGQLIGPDCFVEGFAIDGRKMPINGLFAALKGERVDGHDFIEQAIAQGAVAALVERPVRAEIGIVQVRNVSLALTALAEYWRDRFKGKLIAITGSNGKTTVKEMVASIMGMCGATVATQGNQNNELGVPLTLLRIRPEEHRYAVIEMGANHVGEIKRLCEIAKPDVTLINNVGKAHLEGFGSIEDIVKAKSEIYGGLRENGIAIVNADDAYKETFLRNAQPHACILFSSIDPNANVFGEYGGLDGQGAQKVKISYQRESIEARLALLGRHNFMNALAAAACALTAGASLQEVCIGLERVAPVPGRLNRKAGIGNTVVIDDTYNANPSSCAVALAVLSGYVGKKVFVLGDMGELGVDAASLHADVGRIAYDKGIDEIYTLGQNSCNAAEAFPRERAFCFEESEQLQRALLAAVAKGDMNGAVILVKGSRFMQMERVVRALCEPTDSTSVAGVESGSGLKAGE